MFMPAALIVARSLAVAKRPWSLWCNWPAKLSNSMQ